MPSQPCVNKAITATNGFNADRVDHGLASYTQSTEVLRYFDKHLQQSIILVDTPGFYHTDRDDLDMLRAIAQWLKKTCGSGTQISGVIYFHRISSDHTAGPVRALSKALRRICGDDALNCIGLVTTMWDEIPEGIKREGQFGNALLGTQSAARADSTTQIDVST
ncbi:hypothetical protein NLJ89_g10973 [Agrocybe chaxingu]|uniref:G domain-containing protein n=1 Tax=Agrocybe chaxingu TaxID=84603 RepID=A0A9W8MS30_9AGAR|nr:hypothetical protein NLJ89_g10973 [Agrocybe chaxingu]